ncbi:alpha/beta hydrolase, partial [Saprospiraceae bacterium]|nr:alpha/beta hydrolase [Saprospiraceae bacterium]
MKRKILLLHGALGSREQFLGLKSYLASTFEVLDFNFQGHGDRVSIENFSIDLFTQNVIEFLRVQKIEKTLIFGYSMGGYVALNLANHSPSLVSKIMTLGTKFDWSKESSKKEIKMLNPSLILEKVPAYAEALKVVHSANSWKDVVNKTAQMMLNMGNGERLEDVILESIPHEVLIGIGNKDRMVSIEESDRCAKLLPNGNLKVIDNFVHPLDKIDAKELATIIEEFMST